MDDRAPGFDAAFAALVDRPRAPHLDVRRQVEAILARIAQDGDAALLDYSAQFDRLRLGPQQLRLSAAEIADAVAGCPAALAPPPGF